MTVPVDSMSRSPRFSLVVPTVNRLETVRSLFMSLRNSTFQDFEVILMDQNDGALLDELCDDFGKHLPLRRFRISSGGVSRARNLGFKEARGEIINFPDDDCELTPGLLAEASARFTADPMLDLLFGRSVDARTMANSVTVFADSAQWITPRNVYGTTVEFTMFVKHDVFSEVGLFDEKFGPGTFYGAEEGADFVLRALYLKRRAFFDPTLIFHHAQKVGRYDAAEFARAFGYGRGFGRLSVKHLCHHRQPGMGWRFLYFQCRTLVGMVLFALRFNLPRSRYYLNCFMGRIAGALGSVPEFCGRNTARQA